MTQLSDWNFICQFLTHHIPIITNIIVSYDALETQGTPPKKALD